MNAELIAEAKSFGYNDNQLIGRLVAALEDAERKLDFWSSPPRGGW